MLHPSSRKVGRLPEGDEEQTPERVLSDAVSGLRGISMWVAALAAGFLLIMGASGRLFSDLLFNLAGALVLTSALTTILASRLVEQSARARLLVTVGSAVPLVIIGATTVFYFISGGGFGFLPAVAILICAAYTFGLLRLRRPDVQEYFWSLRAQSLRPGPGIVEQELDGEVVLSGLDEEKATTREARKEATAGVDA